MMKVEPKTIQIAREKNQFVLRLMIDARTRDKKETDCTVEWVGPISAEQRKELLDLIFFKFRGLPVPSQPTPGGEAETKHGNE